MNTKNYSGIELDLDKPLLNVESIAEEVAVLPISSDNGIIA